MLELRSHGQELLDLPNVGRNLCDHRTLSIRYRLKRGGSNLGLRGMGFENAIAILRYMRKLAARPALAPHIIEEIIPGAGVQDDAGLLESTFKYGSTGFHVAGTCRMGSDTGAVLDPKLRVKGIDRLRVVDTSVMPSLVSGNTSAPAMAIAWRAAEMILSA